MEESDDDDEIEVGELPDFMDYSGEKEPLLTGNTPEWFTRADAHILFVMLSDLVLTPSIIAENTDVSRVTVSRRLNTLQAAGYVEKLDRGKYKITKDGFFAATGDPDVYADDANSNEEE